MAGMRLYQHPGGAVVFLALIEIHIAVIQSYMFYQGSREGEIKKSKRPHTNVQTTAIWL